jgi:penicillin-binding protein 1A
MKRYFIKVLKISVAFITILVLGMVILYLAVLTGVFGRLPDRDQLKEITNEEASLIYSSDGRLIGKVFAENRTEIREVPEYLKIALISTEDKRFYEHEGYDTRSYLRVLFKSILLGQRSAGGGSTISQQLAKNLFGRPYHGFLSLPVSKIREAIIAYRMEDVYSKEDILLLYLNSVPFGENTYGVEAASSRYFNRTAGELTMEQSALLVGLLKANTAYNPRMNPEASTIRRNTVLALMTEEGYMSQRMADSLQQLPLGLDYTNYEIDNPSGYFVYQVKQDALDILENYRNEEGLAYDLEKDGLRITTTLDLSLQEMALESVRKQLTSKQAILDRELEISGVRKKWENELRSSTERQFDDSLRYRAIFTWDETREDLTEKDSLWHYHKMLNAAVLMIEAQTGKVKVWVGGNNFRYLPYDLIRSERQAASSFKPFLYASALEQGYEACDFLENEWEGNDRYPGWNPQNYDLSSGGEVPLWFALSRSLNIPSVNLYMALDKEELQMQCQLFGLPVPEEEQPSLALGSGSYSLYQMVNAFSAFANYGAINEPVMIDEIRDRDGNLIYEHKTTPSRKAVSGEVAGKMNKILVNAVNEGTGASLHGTYGISSELAGKTGTSQDYSDAWFFAYTENMICGVWVGAMSPSVHFRTGANGSGSRLALPILGRMIKEMERSSGYKEQYLTGFRENMVDSAQFACDTLTDGSAVGNFLRNIFGNKKSEEQTVEPDTVQEEKKEGKVKRFFKRLFGKDEKKKKGKNE